MEKAVISTKFGNIKIEFMPEVAPGHVSNFLKLANEGFYNQTIFHRVINGFMIQGGCPNSKPNSKGTPGTGGPGYQIKAEFNDISHKRGIVSMARSSAPDSAGSQFFIVHKDSKFLDKQYTVFGKVVEGMEVVDQIAELETNSKDSPRDRVEMTVTVINE
ncbi:peptidylprolyl isomerase [Myxococcota bacterium]|nr:peptidylprolyl isomerase [Myxococcota bacterium]MBU1381658.1 peptidylprolyl isomerase [Myxococcota bacterium]MBU1497562.1 peptidylprolyl isomerase [Myxococcota bacterium]